MANVMLTDVCNLKCPYCFANEFVNRDANEISIANFCKALDFIASGNENRLGLIGGEPTLHSKFGEILKIVINDKRFDNVILFTNGIELGEYVNELLHPKFHILINCNNPNTIGIGMFNKMCANIELLINKHYMKDRITLGINIYEDDFEYDYLLKLLKKYSFDRVRMSIVVPNTSDKRDIDVKSYFNSVKPKFKEFLYSMLENGIIPQYDCNKMPVCLLTEEEIFFFKDILDKVIRKDALSESRIIDKRLEESSIYTEAVHCSPVIDIRQDLTAVRCFGLSCHTKVDIREFKTINDLRAYYYNEVDSLAYKVSVIPECINCYKRKTRICMGGCLAFKINNILKLNDTANNMVGCN